MDFATALRGLVALLWLVVVVLIGLAVLRASRGQKVKALSQVRKGSQPAFREGSRVQQADAFTPTIAIR